MLRTSNRAAVAGFSSMFSLPNRTRPAIRAASSSTIGAIIRHGAHQAAQRSSTTGTGDRSTSAANVASVTVMGATEAGNGVLHRPQRGVLPCSSRARGTRFSVPHPGHATSTVSPDVEGMDQAASATEDTGRKGMCVRAAIRKVLGPVPWRVTKARVKALRLA